MSGSFASMLKKSRETPLSVKASLTARITRAARTSAAPRAEATYMEAKEQISHTSSDIVG